MQDFGLQEIQKEFVLLLSTAVIVTAVLNSSYSTSQPEGPRYCLRLIEFSTLVKLMGVVCYI